MKTLMNIVFNHNSTSAFYDGIKKSCKILTLDDQFQTVDMAGSPNTDYIDTIRIINTAPALLPVAVAEQKKDAWFTGEWVVSTTNVTSINPKSITSAAAVARRLHMGRTPAHM